jgi:hypothetical protein
MSTPTMDTLYPYRVLPNDIRKQWMITYLILKHCEFPKEIIRVILNKIVDNDRKIALKMKGDRVLSWHGKNWDSCRNSAGWLKFCKWLDKVDIHDEKNLKRRKLFGICCPLLSHLFEPNGWGESLPHLFEPNGWGESSPHLFDSNGWGESLPHLFEPNGWGESSPRIFQPHLFKEPPRGDSFKYCLSIPYKAPTNERRHGNIDTFNSKGDPIPFQENYVGEVILVLKPSFAVVTQTESMIKMDIMQIMYYDL